MNGFAAKGAARLEEQSQQFTELSVHQEKQPSGGGKLGGFAGIVLLAAVLLIAAYIASTLRSQKYGKQAGAKVARPAFTSKDRTLVELLSEVVDIISDVEK